MYIYRGDVMYLIVSNSSDKPIYEQIAEQIKEKIVTSELESGELLPSIRGLAKDLKISVITTKRAYEELEREGYIETTPGKGSFISSKNKELLREEIFKKIEEHLVSIMYLAKQANMNKEKITEILEYLYEERI